VQEIVDTCDFFLGEGRRLYGQTVPSEMRDKQLFTFRVPVGVAGIITAGNFPVAVPSWYLVPALLCGNSVVWKPRSTPPPSARRWPGSSSPAACPRGPEHRARRRPADLRRPGEGAAGGLVNKIGFTGSVRGRGADRRAGRPHLQNACLELGGKNPLVVMPDADLDLAAEGALFSGFGTAGQRCTSLGVAIVHDDVYDAFLEKFLARVESAVVGDPTDDACCTARCSASASSTASRSGSARCSRTTRCTAPRVPAGSRRTTRAGLRRRPEAGVFAHRPSSPASARRRALPQRDLRAARLR
jgi:aldehyde dehydrogenase (NAD+)